MGQYIVSARKYRPSTFGSVVGQPALTRTLKNAVATGRLAQAYLFCGPRGVGKTSCARIFARTINCANPGPDGEACGQCESCRAFDEGRSFNIIELDAASNNSVDNIRTLTEQVNIPPQVGRYRVFIIDEVHMLSTAAFNAFLKTLEEPPSYVVFILATTEKQKVLPTILSRCQIYDFHRIDVADMVSHLRGVADAEGISADAAALDIIARKADGAMRDALSIFDQVAASSMGNITYDTAVAALNVLDYDYYFRLFDAFLSGDVAGALMIYKEVRDHGFDSHFFLAGLAQHVRDLMVSADERTLPLLEVGPEIGRRYSEQSHALGAAWYYRALQLLNDADLAYRPATNKQLLVELTLIRLCQSCTDAPRAASETPQSPQAKATPQAGQPALRSGGQPVPTPKPPVRPSAAAAGRAAARPRALRLDGGADATPVRPSGNTASAPEIPRGEERGADVPFTDEDFREVWARYADAHRNRHILVSAMLSREPERIDAARFMVRADNPAQLEVLSAELPEITSYMRAELGNATLSLTAEMAPATESRRSLTPQELLREMVNKNPELGRVLREWDAEMA